MKEPVLIAIDFLNDFLETWSPASRQRLVQSTNALVGIMRNHDRPIIWVRQEFQSDLRDAFPEMRAKGLHITIQGTPGCQIASDLAVAPSDTIIIKKRCSAFYRTNLDQVLAGLRPDGLILAGGQYPCLHSYGCHRCLSARLGRHRGRGLRRFARSGTSRNLSSILKGKIASVMSNEQIRNMLSAPK
jgi:hypothetical protein